MPHTNEHSPLLSTGRPNGTAHRSSRVLSFLRGDNQPTWGQSLRFLILGSWFNALLVFVPLSATAHYLNWDAGIRFAFSFIAIVPLAKLLGEATEQLSMELGQTLGALLNASFGNAVEIIVGIAALLQGELRIVQTSMLGSILSNLLLVLGCSFLAGGLKYSESGFRVTATQTSASLMTLACITLIIPAAYNASQTHLSPHSSSAALSSLLQAVSALPDKDGDSPAPNTTSGLLIISRGTSIILLLVYGVYLYFQLASHAHLFEAEATDEEEEGAQMSLVSASSSLLVITVVTSFCADYLVASIEETANRYHIPKPFIGLILLPLVANAAEHVTAVWMAMKNKMELTIGISVGSSIQIATFVVPLLVIVGWITGRELTLFFANFETIIFFVSVMLTNMLVMDGKSNYMEGVLLISLYVVIALAFWVS